MVALDTLVVPRRLSTIRRRAGRVDRVARVDRQRLQPELRRAADDRRGARRPLRAAPDVRAPGSALFIAGSAACALAPGVGWLIAARAVQGAGAALVMPLGLALISAAFPPERRGRALGIYFAVTGPRRRERAGRRRRDHRRARLGVDLLGQRAARARADPARAAPDPREPRPGRRASTSAGSALVGARGVRRRLGARARQRRGLGLVRGRSASLARGLLLAVGVRALGAARARPDAADALLPLARVHGGQRLRVLLGRRAVRRGVLPRPVPPDRRSATGRSAPGCGCCRGR